MLCDHVWGQKRSKLFGKATLDDGVRKQLSYIGEEMRYWFNIGTHFQSLMEGIHGSASAVHMRSDRNSSLTQAHLPSHCIMWAYLWDTALSILTLEWCGQGGLRVCLTIWETVLVKHAGTCSLVKSRALYRLLNLFLLLNLSITQNKFTLSVLAGLVEIIFMKGNMCPEFAVALKIELIYHWQRKHSIW